MKNIPLGRVDANDETFRVTTPRRVGLIARSLAEIGLINPPLLQEKEEGGFRTISGFCRLEACRSLGRETVPALVFAIGEDPGRLALIAVWENAVLRDLDLMEQARAVRLLENTFGMERAALFFTDVEGAPVSPRHLERVMGLCGLPAAVRNAAADGAILFPMATRLAELAPEDAEALAGLFSQLRLSLGKQRDVLTLASDISRRDRIPIRWLLEEIALHVKESFPDADRNLMARMLREALFRRRFPEFSKAKALRDEKIRALGLSPALGWQPPEFFEEETHKLTLRFRTMEELAGLHQQLGELLSRPGASELLSG
ncbi:MAG: ParB N-terminal domain-containing protein [Thermodesulfobacteriota bacterium]